VDKWLLVVTMERSRFIAMAGLTAVKMEGRVTLELLFLSPVFCFCLFSVSRRRSLGVLVGRLNAFWKSSVEFNEVEFNEEAWLSNFRGVLGVLGVLIKAGGPISLSLELSPVSLESGGRHQEELTPHCQ